jgi:hypothetical protein
MDWVLPSLPQGELDWKKFGKSVVLTLDASKSPAIFFNKNKPTKDILTIEVCIS